LLTREGRRVSVAPVSIEDLDEVYSCRVVLDGLAVEQAAGHAAPAQIAEMQALLTDMAAASQQEHGETYFEANRKLWSLYRAASGNTTLAKLLNGIGKRALRYRTAAYANDPDLLTISIATNTVIIQAIRCGAGAEARAASEQLIRRGWRVIRQHLADAGLGVERDEDGRRARRQRRT
jgi:DNA-binding GntR family transcriptional regulator